MEQVRGPRTLIGFLVARAALSALLLGWAETASAQWTSIGPYGGFVNSLALHPQSSTTLYAGTNGAGVFKSLDGGGHWSAVNTGLTAPYVAALALDPQSPTTLYAGTGGGVFKWTVSLYTLTVGKAGGGSGTVTSNPPAIDCGIDCTEPYAAGTPVALTPTASLGSTFTGWGGDCTGTGSCLVTMDGPRSVTATFIRVTVTLTSRNPIATEGGRIKGVFTFTRTGSTASILTS